MKKNVIKLLVLFSLSLSLIISSTVYASTTDEVAKIKASGKIRMATSADYAPYEFHKLINGKDTIIGFDVEIAKEIAKDIGVKLEIQDVSFDGLLPFLNQGKADFVIAGMTPDDKRKKAVDFSKIYYYAKQAVMVRKEDAGKYKTIASLANKTVGAQSTTVQEDIVKEQMTKSRYVALSKIPDLIMQLQNKKLDAIVVELPVANGYALNNKDILVSNIKVKEDTGGSAVAVKKGSSNLVKQINKTLDKLIKNGTIDKFVKEANEQNVVKK
jgi:ABC-type amino acid transport substrate-binding protein